MNSAEEGKNFKNEIPFKKRGFDIQEESVYSFSGEFDKEQLCPECHERLGERIASRIKLHDTQETALLHRSCVGEIKERATQKTKE